MPETVPQRINLRPEERQDLRDLAEAMSLSINRSVARAVRAQRLLWEHAKLLAEGMQAKGAGPEHGELLMRIAREFGASELVNAEMNKKVTWGHLEDDGRPAIGTEDPSRDEDAVFYLDEADRLVMELRRGERTDHFLVNDGRLVLPDRERVATAALT